MLLNNLMAEESLTAKSLITSINRSNSDERVHGTVKAQTKSFILPETNMAVKDKHDDRNKCVYSIPIQSSLSPKDTRTKSMSDAKQAFLNATVNLPQRNVINESTLHYAQIAITTESEDTRSTGGGKNAATKRDPKPKDEQALSLPLDVSSNVKKKIEQQQRKVSFKIKNVSTAYRRPPFATKTTMTITSNKVSELTKKFNDLIKEPNKGPIKQSKLAKTIEDLQTASRYSISNSSTPSSTLSSSPNIKIVVRQRRSSKKRYGKKRCSSMDSIDKLVLTDNISKIRVLRSKSDGNKIPKSPKKRLLYHDSSEQQSGSDSIDGTPTKIKTNSAPKTEENTIPELNVVKNVIKKFECEISAQSNSNKVLKKQTTQQVNNLTDTVVKKEKPKVPEKKSSLVLTKNLVLKDGVPKIKTIRPVSGETVLEGFKAASEKRKEPIYDKKKYKTNYIHSEKLTLHPVEIIQEDLDETISAKTNEHEETLVPSKDEEADINSNITPNESFLWRRKSNQVYSDCDKTISEGPYGFVSVTINDTTSSDEQTKSSTKDSQSQERVESNESQNGTVVVNLKCDTNSDFETNLVEAYNKEVLVGFTTKPKKEEVVEDDYEVLEPRDNENVVIIPIKSIDRTSKINCPLPEIPKEESQSTKEENIYQSLLEARSHPEGDESSLHNYEVYFNQLEERTRGDGDSDDGYEYCKSPVKPYCMTSSSGIQIAENYVPYSKEESGKNYAISKSVSGTSTVSYEKIGSERIYEKIPANEKSNEGSPNSRHSFVSSDYTGYDSENIYDTIKHADGTPVSHCYESIPNSPSMVKLRNNLKKQLSGAVQKRLSFDNMSNISQSTMSSEQKTNSIYGQRSMMSYNGQEIAFQVPSSTTSASDRSDRSDDWVDVSDEEKTDEQKIVIVRERSRGRKSPISWSQKVRHQWQRTPKQKNEDKAKGFAVITNIDLVERPPVAWLVITFVNH
ncbi:uncharacterized protein [Battus philenor]|uniref:uncharacterized protein n=1 Tax=Battus philenor TaxID=42288 RepID=UPI0035CF8E81